MDPFYYKTQLTGYKTQLTGYNWWQSREFVQKSANNGCFFVLNSCFLLFFVLNSCFLCCLLKCSVRSGMVRPRKTAFGEGMATSADPGGCFLCFFVVFCVVY